MKKKNKLLKNQKGSISMFVIVSVLFLTFVLIGIYASYANKLKAQEEQLGKIQGNYGEYASEDGMDELYIAQTQPKEDEDEEGNDETGDTIILPAEYQQVEYIQSTGTQYIDTGVVPTDRVGCYVNFQPLSSGTIFGAITQRSEGYYGINMYPLNQFEVYWERSIGRYGSYDYETKYEIEFNYMNSKNFKVDGNQLSSLPATESITTNPIHIFKLNEGTTEYTQYISARLYRAQITNGETLIRDFIPCYRKSDNVVGLYDTVNDVFYTNQGTGNFTKGNDV